MIQNTMSLADGSISSPCIHIVNRGSTGMYFDPVTNAFVFVVNGAKVGSIGGDGIKSNAQRVAPAWPALITVDATAGNLTITAAMLKGGVIARDPAGGARTDTTDTAANIIAALGLVPGQAFGCYYINTADAAEAITLAGGTNVTVLNAAQTLAQNESALLIFICTAPTLLSMAIVGA